jgi:hypothetical protein
MSNDKRDAGKATAGEAIKNLWHKEGQKLSLKAFARKMAAEGNQSAKDWFECKKGALNLERSDKNRARIETEGVATRAAKKAKKKA